MNKFKELINHINNGLIYVVPLLMIIALISRFDINNEIIINLNNYLKYAIYPLFSAFLLYSIADRPGVVIGIVIGLLNMYLGLTYLPLIIISILIGLLLNVSQQLFKKWHNSLKLIASLIIIPIFSILIGCFSLYGWFYYINDFFKTIYPVFDNIYVSIILSTIPAGLMAYDLGGNINKLAFLLGVISIGFGTNSIYMAAIMAGGMIPPLVIAINATLSPKKYGDLKKKAYLNYLNGLLFITEGVIEFINKDPKKYRIVFMLGSALAGLITSLFATKTMFPHGGILVVWSMENWHGFLIALLVGSLIVQPFIFKLDV